MAYVIGWKTKYECPICKVGTSFLFKSGFRHPDKCMVLINGYPIACENNGKVLQKDEINTVTGPDIVGQ